MSGRGIGADCVSDSFICSSSSGFCCSAASGVWHSEPCVSIEIRVAGVASEVMLGEFGVCWASGSSVL